MHDLMKHYVDVFNSISISDAYCIVDDQLRYLSGSQNFFDINGDHDMIGKRLRETNSKLKHLADEYLAESIAIINSPNTKFHFIAKIKTSETVLFYDLKINKILEPETSKFLGLIYVHNKFWPPIGLIKHLSSSKSPVFIMAPNEISITDQNISSLEHEIIWLLVMGKSQKEIAFILSQIEKREINRGAIAQQINRNIYPKFEVNDPSSLIAKIGSSWLMANMPLKIFNHFSE